METEGRGVASYPMNIGVAKVCRKVGGGGGGGGRGGDAKSCIRLVFRSW